MGSAVALVRFATHPNIRCNALSEKYRSVRCTADDSAYGDLAAFVASTGFFRVHDTATNRPIAVELDRLLQDRAYVLNRSPCTTTQHYWPRGLGLCPLCISDSLDMATRLYPALGPTEELLFFIREEVYVVLGRSERTRLGPVPMRVLHEMVGDGDYSIGRDPYRLHAAHIAPATLSIDAFLAAHLASHLAASAGVPACPRYAPWPDLVAWLRGLGRPTDTIARVLRECPDTPYLCNTIRVLLGTYAARAGLRHTDIGNRVYKIKLEMIHALEPSSPGTGPRVPVLRSSGGGTFRLPVRTDP